MAGNLLYRMVSFSSLTYERLSNSEVKATEGCQSFRVTSPTAINRQQPSGDDSLLYTHQMSLTPQLSRVANLNSKSVATIVEFDDLTAGVGDKRQHKFGHI